jgi:D-alanyl-D-alanine carboxypeptidase
MLGLMPVVVNGRRVGVERNGVFTSANTDAIPGGRLWPEAALTWNAMRATAIRNGIPASEFMPRGPNSSARTLAAQRWFWTHQPPPAAYPGTSNHGWGIAVDVKTRRAAAWLMRKAHRFGWSHDEGARVGEWWHFRYVGVSRLVLRRLRRELRRWEDYSDAELRWIGEYDRLLRARRDVERRRVLRRVMAAQRKRIWRAAQPRSKGGDGRGWRYRNRRARYESLLARTK